MFSNKSAETVIEEEKTFAEQKQIATDTQPPLVETKLLLEQEPIANDSEDPLSSPTLDTQYSIKEIQPESLIGGLNTQLSRQGSREDAKPVYLRSNSCKRIPIQVCSQIC